MTDKNKHALAGIVLGVIIGWLFGWIIAAQYTEKTTLQKVNEAIQEGTKDNLFYRPGGFEYEK